MSQKGWCPVSNIRRRWSAWERACKEWTFVDANLCCRCSNGRICRCTLAFLRSYSRGLRLQKAKTCRTPRCHGHPTYWLTDSVKSRALEDVFLGWYMRKGSGVPERIREVNSPGLCVFSFLYSRVKPSGCRSIRTADTIVTLPFGGKENWHSPNEYFLFRGLFPAGNILRRTKPRSTQLGVLNILGGSGLKHCARKL